MIGWQLRVKPGDFIRVKRTGSPGTHLPTQTLDKVRTEMSLHVLAYIYRTRPAQGAVSGFGGIGCRNLSGRWMVSNSSVIAASDVAEFMLM